MIYGNGTTTSSNGANVRVDALKEKGIRAAKRDIIFEQLIDKETMPLQHGKTLKVHKTLYILDDLNVNADGLGQAGEDLGAGGGNLYGSSRSVADISAGLPLLSEGAGRVNRVGMTRITKTGTLTRMGAFLEYTDEVELFSDAKMEIQYYEKMGELAAELYDDYLQKEMLGGAGINTYAGLATSIGTLTANDGGVLSAGRTDVLDYDDIITMQDTLKANHAKKHTEIITGSTKVGTVPVNASYFAYCGQESRKELTRLVDYHANEAWTPARMYAAAGNLAKNEVGAVDSTRFIEAQRMQSYPGAGTLVGVETTDNSEGFKTTTLTAAQAANLTALLGSAYLADAATTGAYTAAQVRYNVYPMLWVTKGAFASIGLQGNKKINFLAKKPGMASYDDPHGLQGIYSFNFFAGSIALEPEKMGRLCHLAR